MLLFVSWRNKYAIIEWPPFDAPTNAWCFLLSFSLSRCCCLHFCRDKIRLMLAQGYFKGQRSSIVLKLQLFMTLCDMQSSSVNYSMHHQVPMVSTSFSLSKWYCLHFCRNKFGAGIFLRVKGQGLIANCNFLWICNHRVVITRCAIEYPRCFNFF